MRRSRRWVGAGAFLVLALSGEVSGRWALAHLPLVSRVPHRSHTGEDAWPFLVISAKIGLAILLALLARRLVKAHRSARAAENVLSAVGCRPHRPVPILGFSPRVWLLSFLMMTFLDLVPRGIGAMSSGCWGLATPWLHSQALPVFAVIAALVAVLWQTTHAWLRSFDRHVVELRRLIRSWFGASQRDWATTYSSVALCSVTGLVHAARPPPRRS